MVPVSQSHSRHCVYAVLSFPMVPSPKIAVMISPVVGLLFQKDLSRKLSLFREKLLSNARNHLIVIMREIRIPQNKILFRDFFIISASYFSLFLKGFSVLYSIWKIYSESKTNGSFIVFLLVFLVKNHSILVIIAYL
jgi:hypothetical protein